MQGFRLTVLACVLGAGGLGGQADAVVQYTVTDLGAFNEKGSTAQAINDAGQIVGTAFIEGGRERAFLWEGNGPIKALPIYEDSSFDAHGINALGQIVGDGPNGPFIYSKDGPILEFAPTGNTHATGINDLGQVVGDTVVGPARPHAFVYSEREGMKDLGTLGGSSSYARAISNDGRIVGSSSTSSQWVSRAFVSRGRGMMDLGTLGGASSTANDINDAGYIVGGAEFSATAYRQHATVWGPSGYRRDLTPSWPYSSEATAINGAGQVVGYVQISAGLDHAFIWDGSMGQDLNDLIDPAAGWVLEQAYDINSSGQIVGQGYHFGGNSRAFLLTPIPEPATLTMTFLGCFVAVRRKKTKGTF